MNKLLIIYSIITFLVILWIQRSDKLNDKKKKNKIIKIFNFIKLPLLFTGILLLINNTKENDIQELSGGIASTSIIDFLTETPNF